jgi:hypothetical protein
MEVRDFIRSFGLFQPLKGAVPPPWTAFPNIDPENLFWRMGRGETCWADFNRYYFSLPERKQVIYQLTNPVPVDWKFYVRGYDQGLI